MSNKDYEMEEADDGSHRIELTQQDEMVHDSASAVNRTLGSSPAEKWKSILKSAIIYVLVAVLILLMAGFLFASNYLPLIYQRRQEEDVE